MPSPITAYRIFIASPGGLEDERAFFRDAILAYNEEDAIERGVYFIPMGWENTPGGVGRPQQTINRDVRRCDYFLMVLWNRWGSPPGDDAQVYTSGSEEEFGVARECYEDKSMREIVVMFKEVDPVQLEDPGRELRNVLEFRKRLERERSLLFETFDERRAFERKLRTHLARWLREHEEGGQGGRGEDDTSRPVLPTPPPVALEAPTEAPEESSSEAVRGAEQLATEGRVVEAEQAFAEALPQGDLDTLNRYGAFLVDKGSHARAIETFTRLHDLAVERNDDEWAVTALNNLGSVYEAQVDLELAESSYRKALEIRERSLGPDHRDVVASLNNLARVYIAQGRLQDAEPLFIRALEIQGVALAP